MDPLRREVMAPKRPVGLLGPLFVLGSTLVLTMAMTAMAMAPRPHHYRGHGSYRHHTRTDPAPAPMPAPRDRRCGAPVYHAGTDGMVDATYEVCTNATGSPGSR